jgi:hypothetical protein
VVLTDAQRPGIALREQQQLGTPTGGLMHGSDRPVDLVGGVRRADHSRLRDRNDQG